MGKPTEIKNCFLGLKNPPIQDQNKKSVQTQILKEPTKKNVENSSIILEHCKIKIAEEIEFKNSIEHDLQNNPYPSDNFFDINSSRERIQYEKPNDSTDSIDKNLSSITKKFLFSPVTVKSNLNKPRVQNLKTKTSKNQMKPAVQKIVVQNI